ncbi:hypothetical protein [Parapedobacter soli]|uniref:hypothetical protein n=1 Tax=Parapedobacter soli TaxID=416955 RepID=UPI0021C67572|nr:hypothetical protein [Parapedobacter soli]
MVCGLEKAWWSAARAVNAIGWGAADLHAWVPEGLRVTMATNAPSGSVVLGDVGVRSPTGQRVSQSYVDFDWV